MINLRPVARIAGSFLVCLSSPSLAQTTSPCPTQIISANPVKSADLVCLVPQVYGPGGLVGAHNGGPLDDTQGHEVHFQASSLRSFGPINSEIGVQLSTLPIAPPVAGFVFAGGVVTPTRSFGPVLTDRAETVGSNRLFVSLSYQYFNFDKADGVNLKNFGAVFTHESEVGNPLYTKDVIATQNRVDLKVSQFTLVGTYGITDKLDLSMAVPILNVRMAMQSNATIFNFEPPPVNHKFVNGSDPYNAQFSNSSYSFGMGDLTLRTKYLVRQSERYSVATGVDFRIPTGDAYNFLGAGTWGFRPFVVYNFRAGRVVPHGTAGIQGNGPSILAGDVSSSIPTKEHLPNVLTYSFGADVSIANKIGLAADFIGDSLLHASKIAATTSTDYGGNVHQDLSTSFDTVHQENVALGIKINPKSDFLITGNVLFRLNDAGLHFKPVPLLGVSYLF